MSLIGSTGTLRMTTSISSIVLRPGDVERRHDNLARLDLPLVRQATRP